MEAIKCRAKADGTRDPRVGRDTAGDPGDGLVRADARVGERDIVDKGEAGQVDRPASSRDDVSPLLLEVEREGRLSPFGRPGGRAQRRGAREEHPDQRSHLKVRFPSASSAGSAAINSAGDFARPL
jgi:hypothetical protein